MSSLPNIEKVAANNETREAKNRKPRASEDGKNIRPDTTPEPMNKYQFLTWLKL